MKEQEKTKYLNPSARRKYIQILLLSLPSILILLKIVVENRCSLMECDPASWSKIQEIVSSNSKSWITEYRFDYLDAFLTIDEIGSVKDINYVVYYVSTKQEGVPYETNYPRRQIRFDNKNLWVDSSILKNFSKSLPSNQNLPRLKYVLIEPQDTITLTWELANTVLGQKTTKAALSLTFEDNKLGIDSMWEVTYFGTNKELVHYWMDAQSGTILSIR